MQFSSLLAIEVAINARWRHGPATLTPPLDPSLSIMNRSTFANRLANCFLSAVVFAWSAQVAVAQATFEGPTIDYLNAEVHDPVAQLAAAVDSRAVKLEFDSSHGYLRSVLQALDIPISSQTLVFSKTSLQLQRISPRRPRALYFNDEVYVGWCQQGDVLEFASTDPWQGATFYTLKQSPTETPRFVRDRGQCLTCHASARTQGVPGYLVRSVFPDSRGQPILGSGTFTTDHKSTFEERWGGWYVTGRHGAMRHMGNQTFSEEDRQHNLELGANRETLDGIVSTTPYLSPHSDIVALMVLEHQTQVHNALVAANYETREALHQSFQMNELLERGKGHVSDLAKRRIDHVAERLVGYLLMCNEFPLTAPVSGSSRFADEFMARSKHDSPLNRAQEANSPSRSLRELDLQTRLFRYPCSFLVYSPSFDRLPEEVRLRVIRRMLEVLEGRDDSKEFAHLTVEMRRDILQILRDTKPEFTDTHFLSKASVTAVE